MNEETAPKDREDDTAGETSENRSPRPRLVFAVIMPGAVLFLGVVAFLGFFDGLALLAGLTRPPLVPGKGQVIYQGKPLPNAQLFSRPLRGNLKGAAGFCDDDGRFEWMTDIQGEYIKGAYAGEHMITVIAYGPQPGPISAPPLFSPKQYASFATTPLRITVSRSPGENEFLITLEGEPGGMPEQGPGGGPPPSSSSGRN